jgi:hypothetical protein
MASLIRQEYPLAAGGTLVLSVDPGERPVTPDEAALLMRVVDVIARSTVVAFTGE